MTKKLNTIEKLIEKLCPEGVEFRELGGVCDIADNKRKPVKASLRVTGDIPYYGANNIQDYVEGFTHDGDFVLIAEDGSASLENYSIQFASGKFWANNHVHVVTGLEGLNNRFLFHYFKNMDFVPYLTGLPRAKLTRGKMEKIKIPIPPLPIQEEIVKILDTFTELEAELEAELETRKKQYEYYRDKFVFGEKCNQVPLGDIATIGTGSHNTQDAVEDGEYIFYARGREPLRLNSYDFDENAIITAGDGVGVGKVFHFTCGKYALHQRAYRIVPNKDVNARFLYHYIVANFATYLEKTSVHASVTSLRRPMFLNYPVLLPPPEKQKEIVATLDKFNALVNDISIGLPAELKARRQQYEYYREQLLTFKEKK